jgi:hypothetical protein
MEPPPTRTPSTDQLTQGRDEMKTNPMNVTDLRARMQRIEDNLQVMHTYFDALFGKDLTPDPRDNR